MSTSTTDARALFSADGREWQPTGGAGPVTKVVIGSPPRPGEEAKPVMLGGEVLDDLRRHLAAGTVTHLYLWQVTGQEWLTELPKGLKVLDLRGCRDLVTLPELPEGLEELVLMDCEALGSIGAGGGGAFPALWDLCVSGAHQLDERTLWWLLGAAPGLRQLDFSGNERLTAIPAWPSGLERVELNGCGGLCGLPKRFPARLRRLGLKNCGQVTRLPEIPKSVDHIDLAGMGALEQLPAILGEPRTLYLYGSGISLDSTLLGETEETNVAADVLADQGEAVYGSVEWNEVKVILLGNGRAGKSSLLRCLRGEPFDGELESTHGIQLWQLMMPFKAVDDEPGKPSEATVNFWDFGGQHLYESTHRLFLQNQAVFLVCGNDCGPGSDDETDRAADARYDREEDIEQGYGYWREQIESLGCGPRGERPPVLVLTTKADRELVGVGWARSVAGLRDAEHMEFSAKTPGAGLGELRKRLSECIAKVLGGRNQRALGARPAEVKRHMSKLQAMNNREWAKGSHGLTRRTPVHARMSRSEFHDLVRRHCPDGRYAEDPDLLLRRWHRAGFLYWNQALLKEYVILDQRWAIDGIYTVLDRRSRGYSVLKERNGLFAPSELGKWVWNRVGYLPEDQRLFLSFMEACRVVIPLLTEWETGDEARYLAPRFLSSGEHARREPPSEPNLTVPGVEDVDCDVMVRLFREVALLQGREFERWKWGLRCDDRTAPAEKKIGESLWAEWMPTSPEGTRGTLDIRIESRVPKRSVYRRLVAEFLKSELGEAGVPAGWRVERLAEEEGEFHRSREPGEDGLRRLPPLLRINISYAGDAGRAEWKEPWTHTAFPRALRESLESPERSGAGEFRVLDYQSDEAKRISSLKQLLVELVLGDVLVVVLSRRYLESPYCMQEFYEIARRLEDRKRGEGLGWDAGAWDCKAAVVSLFVLPDASRQSRRAPEWAEAVQEKWVSSYEKYFETLKQKWFHGIAKTADAIEKAASGEAVAGVDFGPCVSWYCASDIREQREAIIGFLRDLTSGEELEAELLGDPVALAGKASAVADDLVGKVQRAGEAMDPAIRGRRMVEEIERAAQEGRSEDERALFGEWLRANPEMQRAFENGGSEELPSELSAPLRSLWRRVADERRNNRG